MQVLNWVAAHPWLTGIFLIVFFEGIEGIVRAARDK